MQFFCVTVLLMGVAHVASRVERGARERGSPLPSILLRPLAAAALAYVLAHLLATALSIEPRLSLWSPANGHGAIVDVLLVALFFLVAGSVRSRALISGVGAAVTLGSVPVACYALVQHLELDPLSWATDSVSPILSTMGRSNFLGAYMAVVVPFTLLRLVELSSRDAPRRSSFPAAAGLWAVLALQSTTLVLTQARAAWLAAVAGVAVFFALRAHGESRRALAALAAALLSLGLLLYGPVSRLDLHPRVELPGSGASETSLEDLRARTVASRLGIWTCTLPLVRDRWLTGYGPETYIRVFDSSCPSPTGRTELIVDDPHNVLLDELMAAGVVGLSAFALLVAAFFGTVLAGLRGAGERRDKALWAALAGSAAAFLVQAQLNPGVIVLETLFWTNLGLAEAARASSSPMRAQPSVMER